MIASFFDQAGSQPAADLRTYITNNYTKRELAIPMRDGVKLHTVVYEPRERSEKYPILLTRTPFSTAPYGKDVFPGSLGPNPLFARKGYIFVYQDVRGLWLSEGEFEHLRPSATAANRQTDETTDAYDTVDWLVKNVPNNNGRVGIYGVSYPGFYALAGIIDSHPAIKAASPQAPVTDSFMGDDLRHNGVPFLAQNFAFYTFFQQREQMKANDFSMFEPFAFDTEDGYNFFLELGGLKNVGDYYQSTLGRRSKFWDEVSKHPNYDKFWKDRNILPRLKNIKTPVLIVGGWFDNEDLYGTLAAYRHIRKQNPATKTMLVVGPWAHNTWSRVEGDWLGTAYFGAKTAADYRAKYELPFFEYYLKNEGDISSFKAVNVFDTGSSEWKTFDEFDAPEAKATSLYLGANGTLSFRTPQGNGGYDQYPSDPMNPVPFTQRITMEAPRDYMTEDQRFAGTRPDVAVYKSEVLTEDLTVAGDIRPQIFVSTTGTDADLVVKLIDVFPDNYRYPEGVAPPQDSTASVFSPAGYQMLIRGEPFSTRFRKGFDRSVPMSPKVPDLISYVMPGITHTFKKGHRIMVQIQSEWFPLVARNPQRFVPNISLADRNDFQKATQTIFYGSKRPSKIVLPIVSRE